MAERRALLIAPLYGEEHDGFSLPALAGGSTAVARLRTCLETYSEYDVNTELAGTAVGLVFGVTSLVRAATAPVGPLDPLFANPLVSVLPRLFIAAAAWGAFKLFRGKASPIAAGFAGAVGSIVNTVLVLLALGLVGAEQLSGLFGVDPGALPAALAALALSNGLVEAAAAAVFTSSVVSAWRGIESVRGKARLSEEED